MRALLAAMGNPQQQLSVVHIAGTKGKGSVAALISGVLRASGYKVGTYTSPHMFDMRERIVVGGVGASGLRPSHAPPAGANGGGGGAGSGSAAAAAAAVPAAVPISAEEFEALAARAAEAASSVAQPSTTAAASSSSSSSSGPSHFEVVTAMAFQHFVDEGVDIAVIETGLGGATDATNVFGPQQMQAAVLTAVGLDHVDALGGSLESIAAAKAGIMKPGVPVVVGPQDSSTGSGGCGSNGGSSGSSVVMRVFRAAAGAADMQCPLLLAEEVVQVS
jgi:folylpolyglutamate synthase/dihydropteroate synthase